MVAAKEFGVGGCGGGRDGDKDMEVIGEYGISDNLDAAVIGGGVDLAAKDFLVGIGQNAFSVDGA
jgi:hypothetical protein